MIAAQTSALGTLSDCLTEAGWQPGNRLKSEYLLETNSGTARLKQLAATSQSGWREWLLDSPHLPIPNADSIFTANHSLAGPWKFTMDSAGNCFCRGDVPRDVFSTDDAYDITTGNSSSPLACWVDVTTALAKGETFVDGQPKPTAQALVHWLKERDLVASVDGEAVRVTVPLSGAFREVAINWQANSMVNLSAEIGRLEKWSENSLEAAEDFLQEANRRLRLVRISQPAGEMVLLMGVCVRAPGPGAWLQSALEALCTGMALVVQPLAALRESGVADMLLAGRQANSEGGVR